VTQENAIHTLMMTTNFLFTSYSSIKHKGTTMQLLSPPPGTLCHANCDCTVELCNMVNNQLNSEIL